MSAHEISPLTQRLITDTRTRVRRGLAQREFAVEGLFGLAFLVVAYLLATHAPAEQALPLGVTLALIAAYAVFVGAAFPVGDGFAVPSQIVFVPLLLLAPALAPLEIILSLALYNAVCVLRGDFAASRLLTSIPDAFFALGPALVLVLGGATSGPDWADLLLYVAALGAQFAFDVGGCVGRSWACGRARPTDGLPEYSPDRRASTSFLRRRAPRRVRHGQRTPRPCVLVLPLAGLFRLFAREREARVDQTLELSSAYRGTALLLGDVMARTTSTPASTRRVSSRSRVRVGDELGVDAETLPRRRVRRAAARRRQDRHPELDHQQARQARRRRVGGDEDPHDRGSAGCFERVGGLLGRVGVVVRASHERWDGGGYPDGLVGEAIPLAARVVWRCDAWDAMQTDRSYRRALDVRGGARRAARNAGTQFDPRVVAPSSRSSRATRSPFSAARPGCAGARATSLASRSTTATRAATTRIKVRPGIRQRRAPPRTAAPCTCRSASRWRVAGGHDPGRQRDRLAGEPVRVAAAVPALVAGRTKPTAMSRRRRARIR